MRLILIVSLLVMSYGCNEPLEAYTIRQAEVKAPLIKDWSFHHTDRMNPPNAYDYVPRCSNCKETVWLHIKKGIRADEIKDTRQCNRCGIKIRIDGGKLCD